MDYKKQVKGFINYICEWVNDRYTNYNENSFIYNLSGYDNLSYIIKDKAIDKRIIKTLKRKYDINADATYEQDSFGEHRYLGGEIRIKIK